MSKKTFVPLLAALALGAAAPAPADPILLFDLFPPEANLQYGNANKIVVGKFNSLHAVYADPDSGEIGYFYSADQPGDPSDDGDDGGHAWEYHYPVVDGASKPSVAVTSDGLAFVVWLQNANADGVGQLYYTRQTSLGCTFSWCWTTPQQVATVAAEPAIVAQGAQIHLTWTTRYQVRYLSFPAASPPPGPWFGEIVQYSVCPETRFYQPSVAVVAPPCRTPIPKVAFLVAANEPQTFGPCTEGTQVGPQVFGRDMTNGTWSSVGDFRTAVEPLSTPPQAVSLSLASNPSAQSLYLAWSDEQNGNVRTQTTYSRGPSFVWGTPVPLSTQKRYLHVRARSSSAGQFRIAASGLPTGPYPALNPSAWYATGRWSNPAAPTLSWTESLPQWMVDSTYTEALSPQALFWRKCSGATPRELKAYGIFSDGSWPDLAVYEAAPCTSAPINDYVLYPLCAHLTVAVAHVGPHTTGEVTLLDFDEVQSVRASSTGAEVVTLSGTKLQVSWPSGKVLDSWDNGFAVAAPADTLRFSGDAAYKIEDLGEIGGKPAGKSRRATVRK